MRSVVHIVFILSIVVLASCQKEKFTPMSDVVEPVFFEKGRSHDAQSDQTNSSDNNPIPITDPNSDRDDKSRKRN
jgi:hypothetical protein